MPLYDFVCEKCGREIEALVRSPEDTVWCHNCESHMTRRISKPAGFELKGTGWYKTDYKNK